MRFYAQDFQRLPVHCVSQSPVKTLVRSGGQFCCHFVANSLRHDLPVNSGNRTRFDKVIAKIKDALFSAPHTVQYFKETKTLSLPRCMDTTCTVNPLTVTHLWGFP